MANTGGTNGTVTITTTAGGSRVEVTYPPEPGPVGPDVFDPCPDPWLRAFENTMPPLRVDVVCPPTGNPTSLKRHG